MNSDIKVEGFETVKELIRKLPEKVKKREVIKLFGQVANPTLKAMRLQAPKGEKAHTRYTGVQKGVRRAKGSVSESDKVEYTPGYGRRTIRKKTLRKSNDPMIAVGPHSFGKLDGFYMRNWVNKGTKLKASNPFVDRAFEITKGQVTKDAEKRTAKYIQKQIDRLNA